MATVHIGRLLGAVGFSRTVAIKRLHPQFAKDPEFVDMFVDEARLAARIRHPNVVPTLDVVKTADELFLVMEYVQGESLSRLMRRARRTGKPLGVRLVVPVVVGLLHGLHAAHNAKGERGEPLHIVHRDVSPQNVLVGTDGVPRVFDFGIAKARGRLQTTREGQIKGKLAYMAPEQLSGTEVGPQADIYAAAVVLWEALANQRLFDADNEAMLLAAVLDGVQQSPAELNPAVGEELDAIVMRSLSLDAEERFQSAREMARALESAVSCANASEIGEWVEELATDTLEKRADRIAEIESQSEIKAYAPGAVESVQGRGSIPDISDPQSHANSQLSSISVAGVPQPRDRGRGVSALMMLMALLAGGVIAIVFFRGEVASPDLTSATSGESNGLPAPDPQPAASLPPPAPAPVVSSSAAASTSASAAKSSQPRTSWKPPVRPPAAQPPAPPPPPQPPPPPPPPSEPVCEWVKVVNPADGTHTYQKKCK